MELDALVDAASADLCVRVLSTVLLLFFFFSQTSPLIVIFK